MRRRWKRQAPRVEEDGRKFVFSFLQTKGKGQDGAGPDGGLGAGDAGRLRLGVQRGEGEEAALEGGATTMGRDLLFTVAREYHSLGFKTVCCNR